MLIKEINLKFNYLLLYLVQEILSIGNTRTFLDFIYYINY